VGIQARVNMGGVPTSFCLNFSEQAKKLCPIVAQLGFLALATAE
jgi:hypothetical protein